MREILFRGKRVDNGAWIYGYYAGPVALLDTHEICDISDCVGTRSDVDPSTVGQYTGLTDKNGVKIFEGDIIRGAGRRAEIDHFVIRWNPATCSFSAGEGKQVWPNLNQVTVSNYEVIGNVHDKLGLLKESET